MNTKLEIETRSTVKTLHMSGNMLPNRQKQSQVRTSTSMEYCIHSDFSEHGFSRKIMLPAKPSRIMSNPPENSKHFSKVPQKLYLDLIGVIIQCTRHQNIDVVTPKIQKF
jgi:hypothetical protein